MSIWYLSTVNQSASCPRNENVSIPRQLTFTSLRVGNDRARRPSKISEESFRAQGLTGQLEGNNKTHKTYFESSFSSTNAIKVKGRFDWLASERRYFMTTNCRKRKQQVNTGNKNNRNFKTPSDASLTDSVCCGS